MSGSGHLLPSSGHRLMSTTVRPLCLKAFKFLCCNMICPAYSLGTRSGSVNVMHQLFRNNNPIISLSSPVCACVLLVNQEVYFPKVKSCVRGDCSVNLFH